MKKTFNLGQSSTVNVKCTAELYVFYYNENRSTTNKQKHNSLKDQTGTVWAMKVWKIYSMKLNSINI